MARKIIKLVISLIIFLILLWLIVFGINISRCLNCKAPINLLCKYVLTDEFGESYDYIGGYQIHIGKRFDDTVTWTEIVFGKKVLFETRLMDNNSNDEKVNSNVNFKAEYTNDYYVETNTIENDD